MLYDERWDQRVEVDFIGQLLLDAADYIERHGWCQHEAVNSTSQVCLIGAISMALPEGHTTEEGDAMLFSAADRLFDAIGRRGTVVDWNDQSGRTKDEVVALLRSTAMRTT